MNKVMILLFILFLSIVCPQFLGIATAPIATQALQSPQQRDDDNIPLMYPVIGIGTSTQPRRAVRPSRRAPSPPTSPPPSAPSTPPSAPSTPPSTPSTPPVSTPPSYAPSPTLSQRVTDRPPVESRIREGPMQSTPPTPPIPSVLVPPPSPVRRRSVSGEEIPYPLSTTRRALFDENKYYRISSKSTAYSLLTNANSEILSYPWMRGRNQEWKFIKGDGENEWFLENRENGRLLEINDGILQTGTERMQSNQRWLFIAVENGTFIILNPRTQKVIETNASGQIYANERKNTNNQKWFVLSAR